MDNHQSTARSVTLEDRSPIAWVAGFVVPGLALTLFVVALFAPIPLENVLAVAAMAAVFVYLGYRAMRHTTFIFTDTTLTITEPLSKPTVIPLASIERYYVGENHLTDDFKYRTWRSRRQKVQFSHINGGTLLTILCDNGWTYGFRSRETHDIADELAKRTNKTPAH